MFLGSSSVDKDIVHHTDNPLKASKDVRHSSLEMLWGRSDTEWQTVKAISAERGDKGRQ